MYTYYFEDLETGENFFVECEKVSEAIDTAKTFFQRPRFLGIVSTEWAEIMGFDTYQKGVQKWYTYLMIMLRAQLPFSTQNKKQKILWQNLIII